MGTLIITAYSPGLPADDIAAHPEGGADAALAAARALCPGRNPRPATDSSDSTTGGEELELSTFGRTILVHGTGPDELSVPDGLGVWNHTVQTTSGAFQFVVHAEGYDREIGLCEGEAYTDEGTPLPFEEPYWRGEKSTPEDDAATGDGGYGFDDFEWARDGVLWMFGWDPDPYPTQPREQRVDRAAMTTHAFVLDDPSAPPAAPPSPAPRRRSLRSFFRR